MSGEQPSKNQNMAEFTFLGNPRKVITRERDGQYSRSGELELGNHSVTWERTFDEQGRPLEWKFFEDSALSSVLEYIYKGEECVVTERDAQGKVIKTTKQKPFSATVRDGERRVSMPNSVPVSGLIANLKHEFDFDSKGNWIKRSTTTTVSSAKVVHVEEREITYWPS
jgi:hypothetical protein